MRSLIADLWGQVVLEHTKGINFELSHQRLLLMEAQSSVGGQVSGFVEQI